jgi:phosphopantothenoylcysteine synthetase/decarboxylase
MKLLVTAGNTLTPIDRVRGITNIFTGRTGAQIALQGRERGHSVTLLTSHPEAIADLRGSVLATQVRWTVHVFRTFDELRRLMEATIPGGELDAVIHCAAVSDYQSAGVYASAPGTRFTQTGVWESDEAKPTMVDRAAGKVKSDEPELWLRLARTPKLVDFIRTDWGFRGILVKFKLEVGVGDEQLLTIAEKSRVQSSADLMVANTLEGSATWAFLGPFHGEYQRVSRGALAARLVDAVEQLHAKATNG